MNTRKYNRHPLTEAQIEQYFREGYLIVPGLVPLEVIDQVLGAIKPPDESATTWTPTIFAHARPLESPEIHAILAEPDVVGAVEQIFEAPARVYYGMVAVVPAKGGRGLAWHQDNQYSQVLGNALNVFVALCEVTPEKANLWIAPKSHLGGVQVSKVTQGETGGTPGHLTGLIDPANGIPLPTLHKGDACIFDRSTYHRSTQNHTSEHRYAYAAQYCADYARDATTGAKNPSRMKATDLGRSWDALRQKVAST